MGCCEAHLQPLSPGQNHFRSILLHAPRPRLKKKVSFKLAPANFKNLAIQEIRESIPWYISLLDCDTSDWSAFKLTGAVRSRYVAHGSKLNTRITIILNVILGYEAIVSLINNPKYRLQWDTNITKMEIVLGDANLDATICFSYLDEGKSEIIERTVRKYNEMYMIVCVTLDKNSEDKKNYFVACIYPSNKIEMFFQEDFCDLFDALETKQEWAHRLSKEIIDNKTNAS